MRHFTLSQWTSLSSEQLQYLSPHTATFINTSLIDTVEMKSKMRAIRAAAGEDLVTLMQVEKMIDSGSVSLVSTNVFIMISVSLLSMINL